MSGARGIPPGYHFEILRRDHPRNKFRCGSAKVDQWLAANALQQQEKHLSATKVLLGPAGQIAGYYTLATGQVEAGDLPAEVAKRLPRRRLPIAILAWLGVASTRQRQGLGEVLSARALADCIEAGQTFPFVAVLIDCLDAAAKSFFQRWEFDELPGHPMRLLLSAKRLAAITKPA